MQLVTAVEHLPQSRNLIVDGVRLFSTALNDTFKRNLVLPHIVASNVGDCLALLCEIMQPPTAKHDC